MQLCSPRFLTPDLLCSNQKLTRKLRLRLTLYGSPAQVVLLLYSLLTWPNFSLWSQMQSERKMLFSVIHKKQSLRAVALEILTQQDFKSPTTLPQVSAFRVLTLNASVQASPFTFLMTNS